MEEFPMAFAPPPLSMVNDGRKDTQSLGGRLQQPPKEEPTYHAAQGARVGGTGEPAEGHQRVDILGNLLWIEWLSHHSGPQGHS